MMALNIDEIFLENEKAKQTISALLTQGRFPHALLLSGEEGLGKKSFAHVIAASLLCTCPQENGFACGSCNSCNKVFGGIHPDVSVTNGEGSQRSFGVDTIRQIRADAFILPNDGLKKIYILANAQNMSIQAQNALLKILEEPPKHAVFILTASYPGAMLETIRSRVVPVQIEPVSRSSFLQALSKPQAGAQQLEEVFNLCGGNIGRAEKQLENGSLQKCDEIAQALWRAIVSNNEYAMLAALYKCKGDKLLFSQVLGRLQLFIRDTLAERAECSKKLCMGQNAVNCYLTKRQLIDMMECINQVRLSETYNANENLTLTRACSEIFQIMNEKDI